MLSYKEISQILLNLVQDHFRFIFPSTLSLPIQQRRIDIIQTRIRALAWILAISIPIWGLLDLAAFPYQLSLAFLDARLLASSALIAFLVYGNKFYKENQHKLWTTYFQLSIIFIVPTLMYVFCIRLPDPVADATPFAAAILKSYYLLPFVILACLGYFPLTPLESACIVTPFLAAYYITTPNLNIMLWSSELGMIWVMFLLAGVSIIISYTQLRMVGQLVSKTAYDLLTNCLGRRSGEEIIKAMWHYSIRNKTNLAVAFLDLDNFKLVNDRFGHRAGDNVLANVAATIKQSLRKSDFVIRWGGEEFLVLMPDADIHNATTVINRMAEKGFGTLPDGTPQTVSIGIAERINENTDCETQLIQKADERLYQAKCRGKNRIVSTHTVILSEKLNLHCAPVGNTA